MTDEADNVTTFPGVSRVTTPVPKILAAAAGARLEDVVVIGWRQDGEMYFASSQSNGAEVLWLLRQAEHELIGAHRE
jgi:hypothetical protein